MSCESYDLRLTTLSPIHIGSGKSYSCCEFVPAKAKSKGQIVKIIKRVNLTNYYSSLSDDRKDTFLASLTNSNFELKQFDKKIKRILSDTSVLIIVVLILLTRFKNISKLLINCIFQVPQLKEPLEQLSFITC